MSRIGIIELTNWMPYGGHHRLELPGGSIAVTATYVGNPRRSNWGGKTALLEAVEWCLFGLHRKSYEDDVIHGDAPATAVNLFLSDGSEIRRSRARGKATVLEVRDAEGVIHTKKAAEDRVVSLIGFDALDYRATVGFSQGDTEAIVSKPNGERRKIVGSWLGLDAWTRVAARARAEAKEAADAYREASTALRIREEELAKLPTSVQIGDQRADANEKIAAARRELDEVDTALEAVSAREIARQDTERRTRVVAEMREAREELKKSTVYAPEARAEIVETYERSNAAVRAAQDEMIAARALVRGEFDGQCPVTCSACPVADNIRGDRATAKTKLDGARARFEAAKEFAEGAAEINRAMTATERATAQLRTKIDGLGKQARDLAASIEAQEGKGAELTDEQVTALKERRRAANAILVDESAKLRHLDQVSKSQAELIAWIDGATENMEILAHDLRIANIAARAAGPSGIPAMIAEASLADLEDRANVILQGTGLSFTFAWDRETKELATNCHACGYAFRGQKDKVCPACKENREVKRADELQILVNDGSGVSEDVRAKSGGAKVLVASAIRLTAGMMLRSSRGALCAWATVDEPFGALDAENRETLARTFAGLLGSVGLEQAFVVSHDASLLDALPARIEITREGSRSRVAVR